MMNNIKVIFKMMLQGHKASIFQKNHQQFHKQEQSILCINIWKQLIDESTSR